MELKDRESLSIHKNNHFFEMQQSFMQENLQSSLQLYSIEKRELHEGQKGYDTNIESPKITKNFQNPYLTPKMPSNKN